PLGFGVHQLLEGLIWVQLDDAVLHAVRGPAVLAWLLFAWLFLPIWLPISVWLFEPDPWRRRGMAALGVLGVGVGGYLFVKAWTAPATVDVLQQHLHYSTTDGPPWALAIPYVAATCLPLLLCSKRFVVWFGGALLVAMAASAITDVQAF